MIDDFYLHRRKAVVVKDSNVCDWLIVVKSVRFAFQSLNFSATIWQFVTRLLTLKNTFRCCGLNSWPSSHSIPNTTYTEPPLSLTELLKYRRLCHILTLTESFRRARCPYWKGWPKWRPRCPGAQVNTSARPAPPGTWASSVMPKTTPDGYTTILSPSPLPCLSPTMKTGVMSAKTTSQINSVSKELEETVSFFFKR